MPTPGSFQSPIIVAGASLLTAVTAALGMSVKSDYEKNFDFTHALAS